MHLTFPEEGWEAQRTDPEDVCLPSPNVFNSGVEQ